MKTSTSIFRSLLVLSLAAVAITACRRDDKDEDNDTSSASDNAFAEASYNDMSTIADQASYGSLTTYKLASGDEGSLLSACATVTHDSANASDPDSITVDFGTTNCLCL